MDRDGVISFLYVKIVFLLGQLIIQPIMAIAPHLQMTLTTIASSDKLNQSLGKPLLL